MKNKKLLIGFAIASILLFGIVVYAQSDLQNELDNLVNDLEAQGYGWLVDYSSELPEDSCVYVSSINEISEEAWYKTYLTGLEDSTDVFDLKVIGGEVEFDYIVDPELNLVYNTTAGLLFANRTENSSHGARIDAPVLFMDFNKAPETLDDATYINYSTDYVQDNSVYNNYGDRGNLKDDGMWVNGNQSNGLEFDGVDDGVVITKIDTSLLADGWSTFSWVNYYDNSEDYCEIFGGWIFGVYTSTNKLLSYDGVSSFKFSTGTLTEGEWTHVGAVCDNQTDILTYYINGVNDSSQSYDCDYANGNRINRIGEHGGNKFFDGIIDEANIWNRTITQSEIDYIYTNNTILNSTGHVAQFKLDETTGTNTENSASTSNNGTLRNYDTFNPTHNPSCTAFTGSGGCYEFDGVDDYVITNEPNFDEKSEFSISTWFKGTGSGYLVSLPEATAGTNGAGVYFSTTDGGRVKCELVTHGQATTSTAYYTFGDTDWHHVVCAYNGTTLINYVDGVERDSVSVALGSGIKHASGEVNIGRFGDFGVYFNGSLDNIQIWDRALSSDEISALYSDSSFIGKYSKSGDFKSLVFYNDTSVYWNTTFDMANSSGQDFDTTDALFYWKFDGSLTDEMGRATNPQINNEVRNASGINSDCIIFDGTDDWLDTNVRPDSYLDNINDNFSISLAYTSDDTVGNRWVLHNLKAGYEGFGFYSHLDTLYFWLENDSGNSFNILDSDITSNDGNWHYAVGIVNRGNNSASLYVDNKHQGTRDITGMGDVFLGVDIYIGENYQNRYHQGMIDEVIFWNKTLSRQDVEDSYNLWLSKSASTNVSFSSRTATAYNTSDTSLVSQWSFNADNNGTDEQGLNDGTCFNSTTCPTWGQNNGPVGGGYDFDGSDDCINISHSETLNPQTNDFTISLWVYTNSFVSHNSIYSKGTYGNTGEFMFYLQDDGAVRYTWDSNAQSGSIIDADKWYHLAFVRNSTGGLIYIDGVLDNYATGIASWNFSNDTSASIGIDNACGGARKHDGKIDEIRFYNRSLSASEVSDLYNMRTNFINWSAWTSSVYMFDDVANESLTFGNFYQYRAYLESNDTEVSPYIINHTIEFSRIGDETAPEVTIVSPTNTTYATSSVLFNITVTDDVSVSSCWYSINSGITNNTLTKFGSTAFYNATNSSVPDADYTALFWCNDTSDNLNNTKNISFSLDTTYPLISYTTGTEEDNTNKSQTNVYVNVSLTETNLENVSYSLYNETLNTTGLVGYWNFDRNTTLVRDLSGQGNDGTLGNGTSGTEPTYNTSGRLRSAYSFDGVDDYVDLGTQTIYDNASYSFWIKKDSTDAVKSIIDSNYVSIYYDSASCVNNDICMAVHDGTSFKYVDLPSGSTSANVWYHIVGTYGSDGNLRLYQNGVLMNTTSGYDGSLGSNSQQTRIGSHRTNAQYFWDGMIDEAMIFNRTLSSTEISELYNRSLVNHTTYSTDVTEINWTGLSENNYHYLADVLDKAENYNFTLLRGINLDTTPPEVTIVSPTATTYTSASTSFEVNTNENSTCNYTTDAGVTNYTMAANATDTGFTATQTLSNAIYTANFYCADVLGNLNNTESVDFTVAVPAVVTPTTGGGTAAEYPKFTVPSYYEETITINRIEFDSIEITNEEDEERIFKVRIEVLENIIYFEEEIIIIPAGQSRKIELKLTAPLEPGIYPGKIIITSGASIKEILTTINVKTEKSLFDITLNIPRAMKTMKIGNNLIAQFNLLQMGIKEQMDVTLSYVIKDFSGNTYVTESETIAVYNQKTLEKEFYTEELKSGDYVLGVELIYPEGVAVASSHFKIKEKLGIGIEQFVLIFLIFTVLVVFILIAVAIKRHKKILARIKK